MSAHQRLGIILTIAVTLLCGCRHQHTPGSSCPAMTLPMFSGHTSGPMNSEDVRKALSAADVILVGEKHSDAVGHAVELALLEETIKVCPGVVLSMEMLERDEQPILDRYLRDEITASEFVEQTHSADWGGKGRWPDWYQPLVDLAKRNGIPVVAANAPRRYVKLARREGYEALRELPDEERRFFVIPAADPGGDYYRNFRKVVAAHGGSEDVRKKPAGMMRAMNAEAMFRSQLLWDATMADSIVGALQNGAPKVIHPVGKFHIEFDGGTVHYLRERKPGLKVLTIVMLPVRAAELRPEDTRRADIVIYTLR